MLRYFIHLFIIIHSLLLPQYLPPVVVRSKCCAVFHFPLLGGMQKKKLGLSGLSNQVMRSGDVGVTMLTTQDRVIGWSLIFIADGFQEDPSFIPPTFILGRVTNSSGIDWINNLFLSSYQDGQQDLAFHLETDNEPANDEPPAASVPSHNSYGNILQNIAPAAGRPSSVILAPQPRIPRTIYHSSNFILDISKPNRSLGHFFIQPSDYALGFEFFSILANRCLSSGLDSPAVTSKVSEWIFFIFINFVVHYFDFSLKKSQVIPRTVLVVPMFLPPSLTIPILLPENFFFPTDGENPANKVGDVGMTLIRKANHVIGFDLNFPLDKFQRQKSENAIKKKKKGLTRTVSPTMELERSLHAPASSLLGRATDPLAVMRIADLVERLPMSEKETLKFSLQFQC